MNRVVSILAMVIGAVALGVAAQQTTAPVVVFTNVSVVPMDRERVLENQTVVVRDGKIASVGAADTKVPEGAQRIDGSGKFLIPTLSEMHAHIPPGDQVPDAVIERTLFMYAAGGIGTIRGMLGHQRHLAWRDRAAKGEVFSPIIYTSGPSLNGNSVPNPEAATKMVTTQKEAGFDFLKIHPGLGRETFDAMAATADKVGIRFAGHVPSAVGLERALETRMETIDHLDGYVEALASDGAQASQWFGVNLVGQVDEKRIPELVQKTKAAGTWMVPTQILLESSVSDEPLDSMKAWPEMKFTTPQQLEQWSASKTKFLAIPSAQRKQFVELRRRLIKALHDGGVPFLLGSDAPQMWNVPGFSIHRELQTLVAAGLTPYQALATGTTSVARFYKADAERGTIAAGRRADMVLIDGNPLTDIRNTGKISGVMLGGRWMSRQEIQKRLDAGS